ncbi:MAG: sel1 repeat family protein [Alphaproteobacteria bacterium]|nr:MAG: sel1 repeat family protein [Alphaproteobacteria bacterium]
MLSASDILILASIVSLGFVVGLLRKRATAPTKTIDYILRYSPRILLLSLLVLGGKILHGYLTFVVSCPPPIVATVISKELVDSTAASNIRRIAEEGDPFFQLQLGSLYANGNGAGIAQDYAAAYFWYSVAGKVSKFGEASKYMRDQITSYLSEDQAKAIRLKAEKWSPHENVPELKESE